MNLQFDVTCEATTNASGTFTASSASFCRWVAEAGLSTGAYSELLQQHDRDMNKCSISRTDFQHLQPTLTKDKPQADILNSFKNDSVALRVYLASADTYPSFFNGTLPSIGAPVAGFRQQHAHKNFAIFVC